MPAFPVWGNLSGRVAIARQAATPKETMTVNTSISAKDVGEECRKSGFDLPPAVIANLASYLNALTKWNRVMNLVGPGRWQDILHTLIVDSFHLDGFIRRIPGLPAKPVCRDLGAGAGLPGIPLRMLWQLGRYALVEAREKRAGFMRAFLATCPLPGVEVLHGRAEECLAGLEPADLILSRAFMPWEKLLPFIRDFLTPEGCCVLLANEPVGQTLPPGWHVLDVYEYRVQAKSNPKRFLQALGRARNG